MCRTLNALAAVALLIIFSTSALRAQEQTTGSPPPPVVPTTNSTTAASTPTNPAPDIAVIGYYSAKADLGGEFTTLQSRQRLAHALKGITVAKKPLNKGGLGFRGGHRNVDKYWDEFVGRLPEKQEEAEALRPLLNRGWMVVVITDEHSWTYGPLLISPAADSFAQIKLLYTKHEQLYSGPSITAALTAEERKK